jgi:hypothetical protein
MGEGDVLFYPGVGDKRVDHEIAVRSIWLAIGGRWRRKGERAYTWLRERESGERVKASEEGAGMANGMDGGGQGRQRSSDWRLELLEERRSKEGNL